MRHRLFIRSYGYRRHRLFHFTTFVMRLPRILKCEGLTIFFFLIILTQKFIKPHIKKSAEENRWLK